MNPDQQAARFIAANREHLVVSGRTTFNGPERPENVTGVFYTLEDNSMHYLSSEACSLVTEPFPRWRLS